jgi:hypothetical protein
LERWYGGDSIEGSNPSLSARRVWVGLETAYPKSSR